MMIERPPVIGLLLPWTCAFHPPHPTKFLRFDNGQLHGLAFADDTVIEILAVRAHKPSTGQFRQFIQDLKAHYTFIRFWAVMNERLAGKLEEYGFRVGVDIDENGDPIDCMDWRKVEVPPATHIQ